jgi:hypothetical protein
MRPLDQFLHSVQESFAENRATNWTRLGLVLLAAGLLWWAAAVLLRRRRARQELARRIRTVLAGARLADSDLDDLNRIATAGELPLLEIMTVLAAFEHATARLLEREAPTLRPEPESWYARVRRFRIALGFSPLSPHLWLLTTRELVVGDSVAFGGSNGHVSEVNEASFAVEWPIATVLIERTTATLTIDRPDDARYLAQVALMKVEEQPAVTTPHHDRPASRRAFFSHDEQPERQQDRAHMRLRVNVAVRVQILDRLGRGAAAPVPPPRGPAPAAAIAGKIIDVSAGGLGLHLPVPPEGPVARGARVRCWFTLDADAVFTAIAAIVVGAAAPSGARPGEQHLRLSFSALDRAERDRLAAAVARHQVSSAASPAQAPGS